MRVDKDEECHALASGGGETHLGDGLHLCEPVPPPDARRLGRDEYVKGRAHEHLGERLEGDRREDAVEAVDVRVAEAVGVRVERGRVGAAEGDAMKE